jgi:CO/xanthine dehydrogenase FAD-binding subunit
MISFDFEYYRPSNLNEAVQLFMDLDSQGKSPVYYAGGTEIITKARMNQISTQAVIDIKEIPECNFLGERDNKIVIGSAVTMTKIREANIFPLLSAVLRNSSDHTSRGKITIGGNICGKIPYREGVLPFLLCDCQVEIAGPNGNRTVDISNVFNEFLRLEKGELLIQILTDKEYINHPFEVLRRTKQERVDYPLVTIAALKKDNQLRAAFSGVCPYPFRKKEIEANLNNPTLGEQQLDILVSLLPGPMLSDIQGSAEYREYVLKTTLSDVLERMGVQ